MKALCTRARSTICRTLGSLLGSLAIVSAGDAGAQDAQSLRARHLELREQLATNQFQRPLVLQSAQTGGVLRGDVYSVVAVPYAVVGKALQREGNWCDIMMLHLNVKDCQVRGTGASSLVGLAIGSKFDQSLSLAYRLDLGFRVATNTADYLRVMLSADEGPLGTQDYRISLEVVKIDAGRSFLHLSYAYGYGPIAQIAMQGYLATLGRNKVGFSIVDHERDGAPIYRRDMRGVVERNAMRYYLAIEAYLGARNLPVAEQLEKRLSDWFDAVERYPRQLHEMDREEYLVMKRRELSQRSLGPASGQ